MRRWLWIGIVAMTAVGLAVTAGVYAAVREQRAREARLAAIDSAERFVTAWADGDWDRLDALVSDSEAGAGAAHAHAAESLHISDTDIVLTDVEFDTPVSGQAAASYTATFTLSGLGEWRYEGSFVLVPGEVDWSVAWSPRTLHPALEDGHRLHRERRWPTRAPLLDRHGAELAAGPFNGLAGSVGPVTAEQLTELAFPYQAGDVVGQSGLQRSLEARLAGQPGGSVRVVTGEGAVVTQLHEFPATEPAAVRTTLDPAVQDAGLFALRSVTNLAALVAIDVPSGEIRAVVNAPSGGFDRALSGRYAPGSTFKVVTTAALLSHGLNPIAAVDCPGTLTVGGRSFRNAGFAALGSISFREAFAQSCNTAFVSEADELPDGALEAAARQFGFNVGYDVGVPVAGSRFPPPTDAVDHAAAAIGQGRVEATPLHMATVAAAVARGRWVAPRILAEQETAAVGAPLGDEHVVQMAELMRHAVAAGTGTAAQVAGEPVAGKTGTAEFGTGPATHAWFIAFRGDLAIAVLVESGGAGGTVAAPLAARFYSSLN